MLRLLSFDPGSQVAGFACLELPDRQPLHCRDFKVIEVGVVRIPPGLAFYQKVQKIYQFGKEKASELQPHCCIIERAFFGVNNATAIKLGEVRGALTAALAGLDIMVQELTPAEVKKAITGKGNAKKDVVAMAVLNLLGIKSLDLPFDATDALAIAVAYGLKLNQPALRKSVSLHQRKIEPSVPSTLAFRNDGDIL